MEIMIKKFITGHRELVRNWASLRDKLLCGEVDQLVIPENGYTFVIIVKKPAHRPGDIRPLLEKLRRDGPLITGKWVRPNGELKSLKLIEKLSKKHHPSL